MGDIIFSKKSLGPVIKKLNIDIENDEEFKTLMLMFNGKTDSQVWSLKLVKDQDIDIETIERIKEWAEEHHEDIQYLSKKNIVGYKTKNTVNTLFKEMAALDKLRFVKHCIAEFNTDQRKLLKANIIEPIGEELNGLIASRSALLNEWYNIFTQFKQIDEDKQRMTIVVSSAIHDSFSMLKKQILRSLKDTYGWNREEMLYYMQKHCPDCNIVYDNNNVIVITCSSFSSASMLCGGGRTTWCLTREASYWMQYVETPKRTQYLVFDFNKEECDNLSHIGFTVDKNKGITNAHSTQNSNLMEKNFTYNGENMYITNALKKLHILPSVYMKLDELTEYDWNLTSLMNCLKQKPSLEVIYNSNDVVVIKAKNGRGIWDLLSHSTINYDFINNYNSSEDNMIYGVFNLNVPYDDINAFRILFYNTDEYGVEGFYRGFDIYRSPLTITEAYSNIPLKEQDIIKTNLLSTNLLLHKYLKEERIAEAIELFKTKDDIDVNFIHKNISIAHMGLRLNDDKLFETIINHASFKDGIQNAIGETFLTQLLYSYMGGYDSIMVNNIKQKIQILINNSNVDLNAVNINMSSPLCVAAESMDTNWVFHELVKNPKVNINVVDDDDMSALTYAIKHNDIDGIQALMNRPELVIRQRDIDMANKCNVNLTQISQSLKEEPVCVH